MYLLDHLTDFDNILYAAVFFNVIIPCVTSFINFSVFWSTDILAYLTVYDIKGIARCSIALMYISVWFTIHFINLDSRQTSYINKAHLSDVTPRVHLIVLCLVSSLKHTYLLQDGSQKFDPTTLPADKVSLELEIGPSVLLVYGAWLRKFMHLKVYV